MVLGGALAVKIQVCNRVNLSLQVLDFSGLYTVKLVHFLLPFLFFHAHEFQQMKLYKYTQQAYDFPKTSQLILKL